MNDLERARDLLRLGRIAEAERAYAVLLENHPQDAEALTIVGLGALRDGRHARAVDLLDAAARSEPRNPTTQQHRGRAHELVGDLAGAIECYRTALRLKPDLHVARLLLGAALERSGDRAQAAAQFARALAEAQAQGRWIDPASTPPALRPQVEAAVLAVRRHQRETYARLMDPLVARFGASELARVGRCLRVLLGDEPPEYPDPRQRPTFLLFPGLPTTPYLDGAPFPWLPGLEAQWREVRAELEALLAADARGRERVFTSDALERENLRGLDRPPSWNGYYLWRHGERRGENCAACPTTTSALERVPLSHVREHGPEVLFSVFTPGTHLLPHRGVTNTRLVAHLPLIVPENCALNVGGEIHAWQEGRVVVFDDTYEHEAWNRSDRTRVVLIFDVWNPYLTEVERVAVAEIVAGAGDLRHAVEAA
jgi:aspartate beta-hydroxylase